MGNELPPETVCNFFIQWIDTVIMHPDEDVDSKVPIQSMLLDIDLNQQSKSHINLSEKKE